MNIKVNIENYMKQFINEIDEVEHVLPKFVEIQCKGIPYKGFSSSAEIPSASSKCFYYKLVKKSIFTFLFIVFLFLF